MKGMIFLDANLDEKSMRSLSKIAIIVTFGGLLFGYNTGITNGALSFMRLPSELNLSPFTEGLMVSVLTLGAAFGSIFTGALSDKLGRKKVITYLAVIFFFSSLFCAIAPNIVTMVIFRFLLGIAVGGASVTVPTFLAEISTVGMRGKIVTQNELMIVSGQFLAFVVSAILGSVYSNIDSIWRYMLVLAVIPAIVLFIGMIKIPESPRWLFLNRDSQKALEVLKTIRPLKAAEDELETIEISLKRQREEKKKFSLKDLSTPVFKRLLFIGIGLGMINQLVGINIIMYYGTTILTESGFGNTVSLYANTANGLISVLSIIIGMNLMHKVDRRKMLLTGIMGTLISMLVTTILLFTMAETSILPYLVISMTVIFIAFFQGCVGPIIFLMISEIFPQNLRGIGVGISTFFLWFTNFVITFVFPILLASIGLAYTFLIFTIFNVLSIVFCYKYVPETRGKTLEEIELDMKFQTM